MAPIGEEEAKQTIECIEETPGAEEKKRRRWGLLGRLLKDDPAPELLEDLARMNETELDPVKVKAIERRIDMLIIPALAVCYMFYYIDKTTLSYAAIFGIKTDLNLGKSEYQWLSSIFYFGWLIWAMPTNFLMTKFPVGKYLAFNIFLWGVLLMAQAASRDFKDMMILRFLSGAAESTADPAFVIITGMWYTREQQPVRIGLWYSANGVGIALGGYWGMPSAISKARFPHGWCLNNRALCSAWAVALYLFVPNSPYYKSYWFTNDDRVVVLSRKRHDQGGADTSKLKWDQAVEAFIDPKTYLFFLLGFSGNIPNGGISNFGTLIIQGFGFNTLQTSLMQMPYGAVVVFCILSAVWLNTKAPKNSRTLLMVLYLIPNIVGSCMMAWGPVTSKPVRLIGYWLTGSYNATFVLGLSLISGNVGGQTKRAIVNASVFLGVCAGNIIGPFLFKTSEAPKYTTGIVGMLVSNCVEVAVVLCLRFIFLTSNSRRDKKLAEHDGVGYDPTGGMVEDITDWKNPAFRYVAVSLWFYFFCV
ncbi:major facilitator superfamily domain-containing protein [Mucidula mucida]|nr:major facilitator superfamily domain-containing protein [Mucidula mucida]